MSAVPGDGCTRYAFGSAGASVSGQVRRDFGRDELEVLEVGEIEDLQVDA
jgi:hypothetical protein